MRMLLVDTLTSINLLCYHLSMNTTSSTPAMPLVGRDGCCTPVALPGMSADAAAHLADLLKALADPTRLRMLDLLTQQREPLCVCDITAQFDQHQPTISHHLRLLREAGLVDCEKRGVWAYYWATEAGRARLALITAMA
jgi:ArsR family transcriptional regulator